MTDDRIVAHLLAAGHEPGTPATATALRGLAVRIEADCAERVLAVADRYRQRAGAGIIDHQAQIARNAALSCVAAITSTPD